MLTPEELLAALPDLAEPPAALRSLPPAGPTPPIAEARSLRESTLPTAHALLTAARRSSRLLGAVAVFFGAAAGRPGAVLYALGLAAQLLVAPVLALYPALVGTTAPFGTVNLAAGTVAVALPLVALVVLTSSLLLNDWKLLFDPGKHKLHALLRWQDLGGSGKGADGLELARPRSLPLVEHVPGDPNCPCTLAGCAGRLPFWEGIYTVAETFFRSITVFAQTFLFPLWTPAVALAPVFWRTWYGALLGAFILVFGLAFLFPLCAVLFRRPKPPMMQLSKRMQCRAVDVQLAEVLTGYRTALDEIVGAPTGVPVEGGQVPSGIPGSAAGDGAPAAPKDSAEPFLFDLLRHIAASWTIPLQQQTAVIQRFSFVALFFVPAAAANLAAGRCIPAWELAFVAWWLFVVGSFLADLAGANARIGAVKAVVRAGFAEALSLLSLSASLAPLPDNIAASRLAALQRRLDALSRRLDAFASSAEPARFAGFEVTFGTARALLVSLLTVLFALWGLLNGLGVRVVLESYCPGG